MKAAEILMWNSGLPKAINGRLYNTFVVSDSFSTKPLLPTDWQIPDYFELLELVNNWDAITGIGDIPLSSPNLKATTSYDTNNGNNSSGFTALASGGRDIFDGTFYGIGQFGSIAGAGTSGFNGNDEAIIALSDNDSQSFYSDQYYNPDSIRGIYKGVGTPPDFIEDFEGRKYDVVQIGSQYWTVQNWACKYFNDGTLIPTITDNAQWVDYADPDGTALPACCAYNNDESNV